MTRRILYVYVLVVAAYVLLTFLAPVDAEALERYELSVFQYHSLRLTIVLPLVAIWFAGLYGYDKFKTFSRHIDGDSDGRAYGMLANGLGVLAFSLPATSLVINTLDLAVENWPRMAAAGTIFSNYLSVGLAVIAFWYIYRGSRALAGLAAGTTYHPGHRSLIVMATSLLAGFFTHFTLINPSRQFAAESAQTASYYLSDWWILFTIIVPYSLVWYMGLLSAYNIARYSRTTEGILYRKLFGQLSKGILAIIFISMALQFLVNLSDLFKDLTLASLLTIIYLLLAFLAVGYFYVAAGAKTLQKIEEV